MKWLKIAGLIVFISIIVGIVALVTLPYRMAREIDARIAAIKAQGDPVSSWDLFSHVPDSENGAMIYEKVFTITEPGKKDIVRVSWVSSLTRLREDPELLPLARRMAAKYKTILPLVDEASSRPYCQFKSGWSHLPEEMFALHRYHAKLREITRWLCVIAITDAAYGQMDDSMKAVELGYRFSESSKDESTLIGSLVRIACVSITSRSLRRSAQYGDITELQARKLFDLLGSIDIQLGFQTAMKGERVYGLEMMDRLRRRVFGFNDDGKLTEDPAILRRSGINGWLMDARSCSDELFYLKYMDRVIKSISRPYHDQIAHPDVHEPKFPRYALMSAIVLPVYAKSMRAYHEATATLAGDRIFLAVLAYKSKFGSYPLSLDDVELKLGWKLPVDPMTDESFRYRREGKGFIVYGLGKNMKDDNAKTVPKNAKNDDFSDEYPYSNGDGRYSADMIWEKSDR